VNNNNTNPTHNCEYHGTFALGANSAYVIRTYVSANLIKPVSVTSNITSKDKSNTAVYISILQPFLAILCNKKTRNNAAGRCAVVRRCMFYMEHIKFGHALSK